MHYWVYYNIYVCISNIRFNLILRFCNLWENFNGLFIGQKIARSLQPSNVILERLARNSFIPDWSFDPPCSLLHHGQCCICYNLHMFVVVMPGRYWFFCNFIYLFYIFYFTFLCMYNIYRQRLDCVAFQRCL